MTDEKETPLLKLLEEGAREHSREYMESRGVPYEEIASVGRVIASHALERLKGKGGKELVEQITLDIAAAWVGGVEIGIRMAELEPNGGTDEGTHPN